LPGEKGGQKKNTDATPRGKRSELFQKKNLKKTRSPQGEGVGEGKDSGLENEENYALHKLPVDKRDLLGSSNPGSKRAYPFLKNFLREKGKSTGHQT